LFRSKLWYRVIRRIYVRDRPRDMGGCGQPLAQQVRHIAVGSGAPGVGSRRAIKRLVATLPVRVLWWERRNQTLSCTAGQVSDLICRQQRGDRCGGHAGDEVAD
jgi:hypothetical protein